MTFLRGSLTDLEGNWNAKGSNILLQKYNDDCRNATGKMDRGSYGKNMHTVSVLSKKRDVYISRIILRSKSVGNILCEMQEGVHISAYAL